MKKLRRASVIVLALALGIGLAGAAQDAAQLNTAFGVRVIAHLAEAYIGGLVDTMHTLAATTELRSGDWPEMLDLLAQFETSKLSYDAWFLEPDGSYYKVETGLQSANLSDRAYFPKVMAGETTTGDLVVSKSTGRKSMVITVPIFDESVVIGALGVTLYLDDFSALMEDLLRLPTELGFYAYQSATGLICLHADPDRLLEPVASAGITFLPGGLQVSTSLGWTFALGTRDP